MNIQYWFPLGLTGFIPLSKGLSRVFSSMIFQRHKFFSAQLFFYCPALISIYEYWKSHSFDYTDLVGKVISLLFNMLFRFAIAFLPRSKHLLISCLQSPTTVILEPEKIKSVTVSIASPSICHEVRGPDAIIFVFWILSFKPTFFTLFHFHQQIL